MPGWSGYIFETQETYDEMARGSQEFLPYVEGLFSAPPEIDPRPWHKIEDQGQMGSCYGNSASSVCEMCYHIATTEVIQLSRMFAYRTAQMEDEINGDKGATISGGIKALKKYGICPESLFPYPRQYTTSVPKQAFTEALKLTIQSTSIIRNYDEAFKFLASGQGGVEIGMMWPDSFKPNADGVLSTYRPGGRDGGHAVCVLGYDSDGRFWLANSWSEQWGYAGWALVTPECFDLIARGQGNVIVGLSDLTTPTPRKIDWGDTY